MSSPIVSRGTVTTVLVVAGIINLVFHEWVGGITCLVMGLIVWMVL